jgi:hypothetical protein
MNSGTPRLLALIFLALISLSLGFAAHAEPIPSASPSGRVLLVPLNLTVRAAPELEPGIAPVWQELVRYFEAQEPRPASLARKSADALWRSALADPEARGDEGQRDVYAAYAHFARRVAEQVEYESIVIPSLVTRVAKVHGQRASWDGVHRVVDTPRPSLGTLEAASWITVNGIRANLSAASLHVAVLTPAGELRFEGAGGLALLEHPKLIPEEGGHTLRVTERASAFEDRGALREGIEAAFARPLSASRAHGSSAPQGTRASAAKTPR